MINGFGDAAEIERLCGELGAIHDGADMSDPAAIAADDGALRRASSAAPTCWSTTPASSTSRRSRASRRRNGTRSSPSTCRRCSTPPAPRSRRCAPRAGAGSINTASAHSLVASPNKSAYVAAKHGVAGFTKTVALEAARDGVTVNCISPGYVWTPLVENQIPDTMKARGLTREQVMTDVLLAAQPTKQFVTPEQVAALAVFLCRDEAAAITGANLSMDGGWTAQ